MSDKTPRDDSLDQNEFQLEFPGTPEENLTEEEKNFVDFYFNMRMLEEKGLNESNSN